MKFVEHNMQNGLKVVLYLMWVMEAGADPR